MNNLIKVGIIGKPHGISGYVVLHIFEDVDWDNSKSVFIEINHSPVPYLIEDIECQTKKIIIKLKSISSVEEAKKITNKNVLISADLIIKEHHSNWINFKVIDSNNHSEIGVIKDWMIHGNLEWMLVKTNQNKAILLPFNDDLISEIDEVKKVIFYKAIKGMY